MRLRDAGLADEFDRACAVYFREWEDEREEARLKRVLNWWLTGAKEKGKKNVPQRKCRHERYDVLPGGELRCKDCGVRGN